MTKAKGSPGRKRAIDGLKISHTFSLSPTLDRALLQKVKELRRAGKDPEGHLWTLSRYVEHLVEQALFSPTSITLAHPADAPAEEE